MKLLEIDIGFKHSFSGLQLQQLTTNPHVQQMGKHFTRHTEQYNTSIVVTTLTVSFTNREDLQCTAALSLQPNEPPPHSCQKQCSHMLFGQCLPERAAQSGAFQDSVGKSEAICNEMQSQVYQLGLMNLKTMVPICAHVGNRGWSTCSNFP